MHWTKDKIIDALELTAMSESVELPKDQYVELLEIALDRPAVPAGSGEAPKRYWLIEQPDLDEDDDHKVIHTTDLDVYPGCKILGEYELLTRPAVCPALVDDARCVDEALLDVALAVEMDPEAPTYELSAKTVHNLRVAARLYQSLSAEVKG